MGGRGNIKVDVPELPSKQHYALLVKIQEAVIFQLLHNWIQVFAAYGGTSSEEITFLFKEKLLAVFQVID